MTVPFADAFLAGAILSTVLPIGLLIAMAWYYLHSVRRVPDPQNGGNGSSASQVRREEESPAASSEQASEAH